MSNCKCIVVAAGMLSLLSCATDTSSLDTFASDAGPLRDDPRGEHVSSTEQPLVIVEGNGCSIWLGFSLRNMQTEITDMVWRAAYEYMENPWSELAVRSFGTPDQGQYDTVNDKLWLLTLGLDTDREYGPGVIYECHQTGHPMCPRATTKASVDRTNRDEWRVNLCPGFFQLTETYGNEAHGLAYQYMRAILLHEYLHLVGMDDSGGYCECALETATVSPQWAAGNADNYALFITGLANVRSSCELPRVGC